MAVNYPYDAYMLFQSGEDVPNCSQRILNPPKDVADPVEAYADSIYPDENSAIKALGSMPISFEYDRVLLPVTVHEDGFVSTEDSEMSREEIFATWGMTSAFSPTPPSR